MLRFAAGKGLAETLITARGKHTQQQEKLELERFHAKCALELAVLQKVLAFHGSLSLLQFAISLSVTENRHESAASRL